jgi:hypothetical protein
MKRGWVLLDRERQIRGAVHRGSAHDLLPIAAQEPEIMNLLQSAPLPLAERLRHRAAAIAQELRQYLEVEAGWLSELASATKLDLVGNIRGLLETLDALSAGPGTAVNLY